MLEKPDWLQHKDIQKTFELLAQNGGEGRIVGGAVRDYLLGVPIGDVDFCSTHTPNQLIEIAKKNNIRYIETGVKYGTLTLIFNESLFEITSLRRDIESDGRHAKVAYGTSFRQDATRRDFTFNALYMNADGKIFDPLGTGIADLETKTIKFIGTANQRIKEDYLRILRYFRFIATYGFAYDETDFVQIPALVEGISQLSGERLLTEFKRIFESQYLTQTLLLMSDCKIFDCLFNTDIRTGALEYLQKNTLSYEYIWLVRFRLSFPNLNIKSLTKIMKFSNKHQKILNQMNQLPNILTTSNAELSKNIYQNGKPMLVQNLVYFAAETNFNLETLKEKLAWVEAFETPIFPIKGADLFTLGYQAGPEMGKTIKQLETLWLESNFQMSKPELLKAI